MPAAAPMAAKGTIGKGAEEGGDGAGVIASVGMTATGVRVVAATVGASVGTGASVLLQLAPGLNKGGWTVNLLANSPSSTGGEAPKPTLVQSHTSKKLGLVWGVP